MSTEDKEGAYCSVCGGISPSRITTKLITVGGKEIGINKLDQIISEVRAMDLPNDDAIMEELLKRAKAENYIPTSKNKDYADGLLKAYKGELCR